MSRCRYWIVAVMLLMPSAQLWADLGDFEESIKEEQEENQEEAKEDEDPFVSGDDADDSGGFWDFLFAVTGLIWYAHNGSSVYPDYPYSDDDMNAVGHDYSVLDDDISGRFQRSRFRFDATGGFFFEGMDMGAAGSASLTGLIRGLAGPEISWRLWNDDSGTLHSIRLGIILPMIQHDWFNWDLRMGWTGYRDLFRLDGFHFVSMLAVYPFYPISLEAGGGGVFTEYVNFGEWKFVLGIHIRRFRISAGYSGLSAGGTILHAADFGLAVYF